MLIHSIIVDLDTRESLMKAFSLTDTQGLRFKFYSDWNQFWSTMNLSEMKLSVSGLVLCFDLEPESQLPSNCSCVKLVKQRSCKRSEVYLLQPISSLLTAIASQLESNEATNESSKLKISWLFLPMFHASSAQLIEKMVWKRSAAVNKLVIINLSLWKIPDYLCAIDRQLSVSDYLLTHKAYKQALPTSVTHWPVYLAHYKHPMDLQWVEQGALHYFEADAIEKGATEMLIISSLLSAEVMKHLAMKADQVFVSNEYLDSTYREQFKDWIAFFKPDMDFIEDLNQ